MCAKAQMNIPFRAHVSYQCAPKKSRKRRRERGEITSTNFGKSSATSEYLCNCTTQTLAQHTTQQSINSIAREKWAGDHAQFMQMSLRFRFIPNAVFFFLFLLLFLFCFVCQFRLHLSHLNSQLQCAICFHKTFARVHAHRTLTLLACHIIIFRLREKKEKTNCNTCHDLHVKLLNVEWAREWVSVCRPIWLQK